MKYPLRWWAGGSGGGKRSSSVTITLRYFKQALEQIDEVLVHWNKFQVHKCKQRLTKLTEMLQRMRKLKLKSKERFSVIKQKAERRDKVRMEKAETVARVERAIEKELLDRLKLGTYGELYEDLVNLNKNAFEEHLANENAEDNVIAELEDDEFDFEVN